MYSRLILNFPSFCSFMKTRSPLFVKSKFIVGIFLREGKSVLKFNNTMFTTQLLRWKLHLLKWGTSVHFPEGFSGGNGRKRVELKQANNHGWLQINRTLTEKYIHNSFHYEDNKTSFKINQIAYTVNAATLKGHISRTLISLKSLSRVTLHFMTLEHSKASPSA